MKINQTVKTTGMSKDEFMYIIQRDLEYGMNIADKLDKSKEGFDDAIQTAIDELNEEIPQLSLKMFFNVDMSITIVEVITPLLTLEVEDYYANTIGSVVVTGSTEKILTIIEEKDGVSIADIEDNNRIRIQLPEQRVNHWKEVLISDAESRVDGIFEDDEDGSFAGVDRDLAVAICTQSFLNTDELYNYDYASDLALEAVEEAKEKMESEE